MMNRQTRGQSLVEMAFVTPFIFILIFGIIDLAFYVYSYATIFNATRDAAEAAAQVPPYPSKIINETSGESLKEPDATDPCVTRILSASQKIAVRFPDLYKHVQISYPNWGILGPRSRRLGEPIEVKITYAMRPLTPLAQLVPFGNGGMLTMTATTRRSIEALGEDPKADNLIGCQQ
jgi:hypothetical protein